MFTQPSVNQIASAYQGNPQPLAQKVEADKKQHGGIPQDLRQLLALNDIAQGRQNMGIQQALQIPTNMPTVAQSLQQQAQQAIQSRLMDQAREQQRLQQQPPVLPAGTPQPRRQPQGIDALETNVGEEYAEGGIIGHTQHFDGKTNGSMVVDPMLGTIVDNTPPSDDLTFLERIGVLNPENRRANEKLERELRLREQASGQKGDVDRGRLRDPRASQFNIPDIATQVKENVVAKEQGGPRVNASADTRPAGIVNALPAEQTEAYKILSENMRRNPEAEAAALRAKYLAEVGQKDLSIFDKTAAELEARRQKLNAPKAGYDAVMEYLEQVALGGGRRSAESGAIGANRQRQLQLSREAQQNELMDKILELGAKKAEAAYGEKKGLFDLTQAERKNVYDKAYEAAKSVNASDDEAKKLAAQAVENEKNRQNQLKAAAIGAHDNLMSRAQALMKVDPKLSLEDAMRKASEIASVGSLESTEVRNRKAYEEAKDKLDKNLRYLPVILDKKNKPENAQLRAEYEAELSKLQAIHKIPSQGINALPTSTGLPAGVTVTQVK